MQKKGVSGSTLKIIAILAMILDHIGWTLLDPIVQSDNIFRFRSSIYIKYHEAIPTLQILSEIFHAVGRITFPIMLFLIVEGIKHTKSKAKYIRNMLIFALASEIPFNLAFSEKPLDLVDAFPFIRLNNIFFTLALGLIAIVICEKIMSATNLPKLLKFVSFAGVPAFAASVSYYLIHDISKSFDVGFNRLAFYAAAAVLLILCIFSMRKNENDKNARLALSLAVVIAAAWVSVLFSCDYTFIGIVALYFMYLLQSQKNKSYFAGCTYLALNEYYLGFSLLALPLVHFYNGKRGVNLKFFFYSIYPLHLIVLWMIKASLL